MPRASRAQSVCTPVTAFFSRMADPAKLSFRGDAPRGRESEDGGLSGAAAKMFGVRQASAGSGSFFAQFCRLFDLNANTWYSIRLGLVRKAVIDGRAKKDKPLKAKAMIAGK